MVEAPQMIHRHNCLNVSLSKVGVLPYNSSRQLQRVAADVAPLRSATRLNPTVTQRKV